MTYYAQVDTRSNELYKAQAKCLSDFIINIEIKKEVYDNFEKYMYENGKVVINPEYSAIELQNKKEKIVEKNDRLRDEKLFEGVTYNNVLFDSDTDQKTNLLATYQMLTDEDTITWYGKDNKALLCTKQDLLAIGKLIVQLHSYCWNMNAYIKEQIENAGTLEELLKIEVVY